jgi:hypothetical protein
MVRRTPGSSFGDPALVDRQGGDFALGLERHDDLRQLTSGRIISELDVPPDDLLSDLLREDERKYVNHQLDRFIPLIRLVREVHHRP